MARVIATVEPANNQIDQCKGQGKHQKSDSDLHSEKDGNKGGDLADKDECHNGFANKRSIVERISGSVHTPRFYAAGCRRNRPPFPPPPPRV